ncbi:MAG: GTPase ObgE [Actinomycetaceae bacterium]|nr:GTPase ObgE [Actinomycetaceae bacterium]
MSQFIDRVQLSVTAGNGGHGCMSIRREKYKPLGGPDGGNGGHGGSVIAKVNPQISTLLEFHFRPHQKGENGGPGLGDNRNGNNGADTILEVPEGTIIKSTDGTILADLHGEGTEYVLAKGGIGGRGNAALASKRRKAPGFALLGEPGQSCDVIFELKSMADAALVGFPSCGKSSLIGAISAAQPEVGEYPFTTLRPHLGVVEVDSYRYTVADVPGLIPGASQGKGLGLDFLRHIERCSVIVHVIDMAVIDTDRSPVADIEAIEKELHLYQSDLDALSGYVPLSERPRIIALNKMDVPDSCDLADIVESDLAVFGWPIFKASAISREGLRELTLALGEIIEHNRPSITDDDEEKRVVLRPTPKGKTAQQQLDIQKKHDSDGTYYLVLADNVERWVVQTDFSNEEAIGYLAERLKNGGVEDRLIDAGAQEGDRVVIGEEGVVFDFEPHMAAGAELLSARGTAERLRELEMEREGRRQRRTNEQRRRQYRERMDAKAAARQALEEERKRGIWTDPN